jgi:short-subunit dehydrogenase
LASNYQVEVVTLVADLERPSAVSELEARIAADDVTFVVNNAGAGGLGRIADITADQLEAIDLLPDKIPPAFAGRETTEAAGTST